MATWGLAGYIAGFVLSSLVGTVLDLVSLCRAADLRPAWRDWFLSPVLSAVLMGLCGNLLFRWLTDNGISHAAACLGVLPFGSILYLAALQAQGVRLKSRARKS